MEPAPASPLIVTFVTHGYIDVTANWLAFVAKLGLTAHVRIVTLDDASRDAFPAALTVHAPLDTTDLGGLWVHRIQVIGRFLAAGYDVVHSDSDAVWLRDPLPFMASCSADMVFSQGTVWPPDVHARHGLVLCCGLFRLTACDGVRAFMRAVEARVAADRDDQVSINRLLDEAGVRWRIDTPYRIPFRDTAFTASRSVIRAAAGDGPSVAVLPHHLFPRLVDCVDGTSIVDAADGEVMVAHPLSGKTRAEKQAVLSALGLWA